MKFLIVGLGNPEPKYLRTRHNIGFMVLDYLMEQKGKGKEFEMERYGWKLSLSHKGKRLVLVKPNTYMNLSGKSVRYHLQKEGIDQKNLLVVTDDLALPFGKLRMKGRGSSGGHNGLSNIIEILGNQDWARLRMGIGNDYPKGGQVDFVLDEFAQEEQENLPEIIKKAAQMSLDFATMGLNRTMSAHNN